jgi:hypothetical protein
MARWYKTLGKWVLRIFLIVFILLLLNIAALAYPNPLFAHKQRFEEFTVYSSQPVPADFERVIEDARARVEAMENARPGARHRVYICSDSKRYAILAFLSRRSSNSMAIGLSVFGNIYMNEPKIRRMAAENYGGIRHSRFEGDFAEAIAHEIAHFNVVKTLGFWKAIDMPVWKSEGYAEYQANIAATRGDSSYRFADRVDLLMNRNFWGGGSFARQLFEWHLLVEFLADVKGIGLEDLVEEAINEQDARREMLAWYEERRSVR